MSVFNCTFCGSNVYVANLYSPFGDGKLSICDHCIIQAVLEMLDIKHAPPNKEFLQALTWAVLVAEAGDAELEALAEKFISRTLLAPPA